MLHTNYGQMFLLFILLNVSANIAESPRIETYREPSYYKDNSRDKVKRKNTVHFKEDPGNMKKERRYGVVKRDRSRSKSPARKSSIREGYVDNKGPISLQRENTGLRKESSSQREFPKKETISNKREKVELSKKSRYTRKISSFAPLLLDSSDKDIDAQHKSDDTRRDSDAKNERADTKIDEDNDEKASTKSETNSENEKSAEQTLSTDVTVTTDETGKQNLQGAPDSRHESEIDVNENKALTPEKAITPKLEKSEIDVNENKALTPEKAITPKLKNSIHTVAMNRAESNSANETETIQSDAKETAIPNRESEKNDVNQENVSKSEEEIGKHNTSTQNIDKTESVTGTKVVENNVDETYNPPTPVKRGTTNTSLRNEMKAGVKETSVADPNDIESIPVSEKEKTYNITKRPLEREEAKVLFVSNSQMVEQTNFPKKESHKDKEPPQEYKPKKKEVSFVEPTKEDEDYHTPHIQKIEEASDKQKRIITPKSEAFTKRNAIPERDPTPLRKVSIKRNVSPTRQDTSPKRDPTPSRKVSMKSDVSPSRRGTSPKRDPKPSRKVSMKRDPSPIRRDVSPERDVTPPRKVSKAPKPAVKKKQSTSRAPDPNTEQRITNHGVGPKKTSEPNKSVQAPAPKKKASTTQEPATYYINKDNPNVVVKKRTPPKPKPPTPKQSKPAPKETKVKAPPTVIDTKPKQSTEREDVDSLDLSDSDDDDIFARAMRKYGITISDDDD